MKIINKTFNVPITNGSMSVIIGSNGRGHVQSDLDPDVIEDSPFTVAIEAIETLILALACSGVNVESKEFGIAVDTAIDTACNRYGD